MLPQVLEGVVRKLNPDLDLLELALPVILQEAGKRAAATRD